ncbi:MAG: hypothetical protein ACTHMZ_13425 [Actinomycetes bacterium]
MSRAGWRRLVAALRDRGRQEPTRRGYLAWAGLLVVVAAFGLWRLVTRPVNSMVFISAAVIFSTLVLAGIYTARFFSRGRHNDEEDPPSRPERSTAP